MRRTLLTLPLAAILVVGWLPPPTLAQETKSARGTVTAMAADSITVKAGGRELTFTVDEKTTLTAEGAGTAERAAATSGRPGPKLADFVKAGDAVEVTYNEAGGGMRAERIRRVASPGPGGGTTSDARTETSNGTVESVTATSLTISGSTAGGGTFKQTFIIDNQTKVIGPGAGTADAARGGKMMITDYVGSGDRVSVSYHKQGATLHAAEVRVTMKAK